MKAKFGAVVVDGRGKIGGHVASKNRSGSYFRTKVTPVNPNTAAQSYRRSILTSLAQGWRGLTEAQRAAWNAAVSSFQSTNIFGDIVKPTGLNLYVKLNANLDTIGAARISVPPQVSDVATVFINSIEFNAGPNAVLISMSGAVPAGTSMVIAATEGFSAGVNYFSNKLRYVNFAPAATASPVDISTAYTNKYGALPVNGQKIGVEIYFIDNTSGIASSRQRVTGIVNYV